MDFDDLIFKTVELFRSNPEVLAYYQRRFRYIMVDEYQDTNTAQFQLIKLLASYEKTDNLRNWKVAGGALPRPYSMREIIYQERRCKFL